MKRLEDIIKERLEGYESSLPEGDLAEFKSLLKEKASTRSKSGLHPVAWIAASVVAAGVALFVIFGNVTETETTNATYDNQPVARVVEQKYASLPQEASVHNDDTECIVPEEKAKENTKENTDENTDVFTEEAIASLHIDSIDKPVERTNETKNVKNEITKKKRNMHFVVLGGSGAVLACVAPSLLKNSGGEKDYLSEAMPNDPITHPEADKKTGENEHNMPLTVGLSLRVPFSKRWSVTTGIDYSWYSSTIGYSISPNKQQNAHYLSVPLRADFSIHKSKRLNLYAGAGTSVDFCLAASEEGHKVAKDEVGLSLVGVAGAQLNITKNLGVFVEPTLSWDMTAGNRELNTYRSEHPVMFSIASGLRFTLNKKK